MVLIKLGENPNLQIYKRQNRLIQNEPALELPVWVEQVWLGSDGTSQRHDDLLAEGVDWGIGHLEKSFFGKKILNIKKTTFLNEGQLFWKEILKKKKTKNTSFFLTWLPLFKFTFSNVRLIVILSTN